MAAGTQSVAELLITSFTHALSAQGKHLPGFVEREFEDFLRCGRLNNRYSPIKAIAERLARERSSQPVQDGKYCAITEVEHNP